MLDSYLVQELRQSPNHFPLNEEGRPQGSPWRYQVRMLKHKKTTKYHPMKIHCHAITSMLWSTRHLLKQRGLFLKIQKKQKQNGFTILKISKVVILIKISTPFKLNKKLAKHSTHSLKTINL